MTVADKDGVLDGRKRNAIDRKKHHQQQGQGTGVSVGKRIVGPPGPGEQGKTAGKPAGTSLGKTQGQEEPLTAREGLRRFTRVARSGLPPMSAMLSINSTKSYRIFLSLMRPSPSTSRGP